MNTFWIILACINAVFLLMFFGGRNAVWGGLKMGAIIGALVAGGFAIFGESGFLWPTVVKWAICLSLWGAVTEIQAAIARRRQDR